MADHDRASWRRSGLLNARPWVLVGVGGVLLLLLARRPALASAPRAASPGAGAGGGAGLLESAGSLLSTAGSLLSTVQRIPSVLRQAGELVQLVTPAPAVEATLTPAGQLTTSVPEILRELQFPTFDVLEFGEFGAEAGLAFGAGGVDLATEAAALGIPATTAAAEGGIATGAVVAGELTIGAAATIVGAVAAPFIAAFMHHEAQIPRSVRDAQALAQDQIRLGGEIGTLVRQLDAITTPGALRAWFVGRGGSVTIWINSGHPEWTHAPAVANVEDPAGESLVLNTWRTGYARLVGDPETEIIGTAMAGTDLLAWAAWAAPGTLDVYIHVTSNISPGPYREAMLRALIGAARRAYPAGPPTPRIYPATVDPALLNAINAYRRRREAEPDTVAGTLYGSFV